MSLAIPSLLQYRECVFGCFVQINQE